MFAWKSSMHLVCVYITRSVPSSLLPVSVKTARKQASSYTCSHDTLIESNAAPSEQSVVEQICQIIRSWIELRPGLVGRNLGIQLLQHFRFYLTISVQSQINQAQNVRLVIFNQTVQLVFFFRLHLMLQARIARFDVMLL